jgi:hypothetical protein
MKSEQIKEITDRAADQLAAALQVCRSEALAAYLKAIGRFYRYSFLCLPQHRNENVNRRTMLIGKRNRKWRASFCAPGST